MQTSPELELRILGSAMCRSERFPEMDFLSPDDFSSAPMRDIFEGFRTLRDAGEPLTPFTVQHKLKAPEVFKEAGGVIKYLTAAVKSAEYVLDPIEMARELHEIGQRRRIADACKAILETIEADEGMAITASQLAMELRNNLEKTEDRGRIEIFEDNLAVTQRVLDELKGTAKPFSTGIDKLDEAMGGGVYPGKSYGFAARKKVGKTCLAATISANLNFNKIPHLFICGEMSPAEIQQRILARYADIYPSAFRSDYNKSQDFNKRLAAAVSQLPRCTYFYNAPGMTFSGLKRAITSAVERKKCRGIILDYWQLVGGKEKGKSTAEHLDEVAQWVADTGRKYGIFSIVMAQINQEGNTRGSEGIRLAFDQVYELKREDLGASDASLEMLETRYTPWLNISGLWMNNKGPFFEIR